ncbi:hypothetical protein [Paenibacillus macerans]|uniref:hypothetical protein n=1 Tax=Paenibacillus macerans TaxID=44252 RepID=UPI0020409F70|nr:hypothetical protein [Paenibacillus macerans]MCM3699025.1 hypothetical protein [Paenibacillus macerans]
MLVSSAVRKGTVKLDEYSWFHLTKTLGPGDLFEADHPFFKYLHRGLRKNDNSTPLSENLPSLPLHVSTCLTAAFLAGKGCWLNFRAGTKAYEQYLYMAGKQMVKVERLHEESPRLLLESSGGMQQWCEDLTLKMKWNSHTPHVELPALMMSRSRFGEIISQMEKLDLEKLTRTLTALTNDEEGSIALARCLKAPAAQGELRFYVKSGGSWDLQTVHFLNNDHINWLIRFSTKPEEDWLIATPTPRSQFQDMLHMWFRQPPEARAETRVQSLAESRMQML